MKRLRYWLLAAALSLPILGWGYGQYLVAQPTCPGVNCTLNGVLSVPVDNYVRRTYRAGASNVIPYATPQDLAQICGNATTTVRVTEIRISGLMTTALNTPITLVKRSTATAQPASLNVTPVPIDASFSAANTTPITFPTSPTLGTAIQSIASDIYFFGNATTTASSPLVWKFGDRPASALVLRGATQCVDINLNNSVNGTVVTGGLMYITWEWVEDGS